MRGFFFFCHFLIFLCFISCSHMESKLGQKNFVARYNYQDTNGEFSYIKEVGTKDKGKLSFVKTKIFTRSQGEKKLLEQAINISKNESMKFDGKTFNALSPRVSQYIVWIDGKRYFSEMVIQPKNQSVLVKYLDLKDDNNLLEKRISFPKDKDRIFCFYSQLEECVRATGFLAKSIKERMGEMNIYILWDGWPYFSEIYQMPDDELITPATLTYESLSNEGLHKYTLKSAGSEIYYHFAGNEVLEKKMWITQGMTQTKETIQFL